MDSLAGFCRDVYSQNGEDGILGEVLLRIARALPQTPEEARREKWCIEFGAWDGVFLSNTCNLIRNEGFRGLLIEADAEKFQELAANFPGENTVKRQCFVDLEGENSLDALIASAGLPEEIDLVSIDIDGCDFHVWESLRTRTPRIVCIEYNHSMPNAVDFVQPPDFAIKWGNSPRALCALGAKKGYTLAAVTQANLIFVRDDFAPAVLGTERPTLAALRPEGEEAVILFCGYDGQILSNQPHVEMWWQGMRAFPRDFQVVPRSLRRYPGDFTPLQKFRFLLFHRWRKLRRSIHKRTGPAHLR